MKFQNILYNTNNIFIKNIYNYSNAFVSYSIVCIFAMRCYYVSVKYKTFV